MYRLLQQISASLQHSMQVKLPSRGFTITRPAKKHLAVVYLVSVVHCVVHLLQRSEICCNLTPYKGLIPRLSCAPDVMSCSRKARGYCMWEHASLEWGYIAHAAPSEDIATTV